METKLRTNARQARYILSTVPLKEGQKHYVVKGGKGMNKFAFSFSIQFLLRGGA